MTIALLLLLKLCVASMIFAIGLGSTVADIGYLWRRPRLMLRSLAAMYLLVPLAAFLLVRWLPVGPPIKAALLVLAVSAGAPLLPRKLGALGSGAYVFSLVVTSSLAAILVVPTWVALIGAHFAIETDLSPLTVAEAVAKAFLLPLAIGMTGRALWPGQAEVLSRVLLNAAGAALAAGGMLLLVTHWEIFARLSWQGILAVVLLMLVSLAIGHLLGGPDPDDRTTLAIACATRHIGLAVLVATAFPGPRTLVLTAGYVMCSAAVSLPYLRWRRWVAQRHGSTPID